MVECVETISRLRVISKESNTPASDFTCVLVRGYEEVGDGGGGYFVWDPSLTEDDSGTIIKPIDPAKKPGEPDTGCWKRIYEDFVSVKWFGAKGDMKEYYKATDNTMKHYKGTVKDISLKELILDQPEFKEQDEHKTIVLWNDEIPNLPFITTIHKKNSPYSVTLDLPAPSELKDVNVSWGSDDTSSIQKAIDAAKNGGYAVYLPAGHYVITKTLDYITEQIPLSISERTGGKMPPGFQLMKQGLRLFGAGEQLTFLHNLIQTPLKAPPDDYPSRRATIVIDGTNRKLKGAFQQTGYLKDLHITSNGHIDGTVGIDLLANWSYSIENVSIMHMGSDGIIVRNRYIDKSTGISDYDQTDKLRLDNVFLCDNNGWGLRIDAVTNGLSTSRIHVDRCNIRENKSGGIAWAGQTGTIERTGIYGNGAKPLDGKDGFGILVKNVRAVPDGLLISGCEIQDNVKVQIMIEIGANIRIIQNDFKVDRLMYTDDDKFSRVDIQVGDGNIGYLSFNPDAVTTPHIDVSVLDDSEAKCVTPNESVINLTGFVPVAGKPGTRTCVVSLFPLVHDDGVLLDWLVVNRSSFTVTLRSDKGGTGATIAPGTKHVIYKDKTGIHVDTPRTVNACVIQDNRIRANYDLTGKVKGPDHTVVKVNTNAVGTIIGRWWISQFDVKYNPHWKLVELVEKDPFTDKRAGVFADGHMHVKTHLQRDGIDGGHVLLPFASTNTVIDENWIVDHEVTFTPDTMNWSFYRLDIKDSKPPDPVPAALSPPPKLTERVKSITIGNPTARSVGTPLFLEIVNNRTIVPAEVIVKFDTDFSAGNSFLIHPKEKITGILMFDWNGKWTSFSPWTREGKPL